MTLERDLSPLWTLSWDAASNRFFPARTPVACGFWSGESPRSTEFPGAASSPVRFGNDLAQAVSRAGIVEVFRLFLPVLNRFNGRA